jgi:uncharacterized membrane protein YfcA
VGGVVLTVSVGLVSGVLAGAFGIGGGLLTTPAIRLLLGYPALIAVGTPLPVILPGAIAGASSYLRRGLADVRAGVIMGLVGSVGSIAGAYFSRLAGGPAVMVVTAVAMAWAATDMLLQERRARGEEAAVVPGECETDPSAGLLVQGAVSQRASVPRIAAIGLLAGVYSGFLGLGGGFVIVPALSRFCGFPVKRAIGTSLVTVAVLAVPGTVTHAALGHIDWQLALLLSLGVVPGALLGARMARSASDSRMRLAFAGLLIVVGFWLAVSEIAGIGR